MRVVLRDRMAIKGLETPFQIVPCFAKSPTSCKTCFEGEGMLKVMTMKNMDNQEMILGFEESLAGIVVKTRI